MDAAGSGSQARSPSAITFSLRRIICLIDRGGTIAGVEVDAAVLHLRIVTEVHALLTNDVHGRGLEYGSVVARGH